MITMIFGDGISSLDWLLFYTTIIEYILMILFLEYFLIEHNMVPTLLVKVCYVFIGRVRDFIHSTYHLRLLVIFVFKTT